MHDDELTEIAPPGEGEAFAEWLRSRRTDIALFGIQNGLGTESAVQFQYAVFLAALNRREGGDDLTEHFYSTAIGQLRDKTAAPQTDPLFQFEEDQEVHHAVLTLSWGERIPFLLAFFHKLDAEQISAVIGTNRTAEADSLAVAETIAAIAAKLETTEELTLRRLELLRKSYSRIKFPEIWLPEEGAVSHERTPSEETSGSLQPGFSAEPGKMSRKSKAAAVTAGVFMAGFIGLSFIYREEPRPVTPAAASEEQGDVLTEAKIETWREEYNSERKLAAETLGVTEEQYGKFAFVAKADQSADRILSDAALEQYAGQFEEAENIYRRTLRLVMLPGDMVQDIVGHPVNPQESDEFVEDFTRKTSELMDRAQLILRKNPDALTPDGKDHMLIEENIFGSLEGKPEEVVELLRSLDEQMLRLEPHPDPEENRFIARRKMDTFMSTASNHLTGNQFFLFTQFLASEPFVDDTGLLYDEQMAGMLLQDIGYGLVDADEDSFLYKEAESAFTLVFWLLLHGSEEDPILAEGGKVPEETRTVWKQLLEGSMYGPVIYVMSPIISEMEASGWTASESYDQLQPGDIVRAISMEKKGVLEELLPGGDMEIGEGLVNASADGEPLAPVADLYNRFIESYQDAVLEGVSAKDVFLLYQYAIDANNPEAVWHLLSDELLKPSLETFIAEWEPEKPFAERYEWVEFTGVTPNRQGRTLFITPAYSSDVTEGGSYLNQGPVVETEGKVWKVQYQLYERRELGESEKGTAFWNEADSLLAAYQKNRSADSRKELSAIDTLSLYLSAWKAGNYEVMANLMTDEFMPRPTAEELKERVGDGKNRELLESAEVLELAAYSFPGMNAPEAQVLIRQKTIPDPDKELHMSLVLEEGIWQVAFYY